MPSIVVQLAKTVTDIQKTLNATKDEMLKKIDDKDAEYKKLESENVELRLKVAELSRNASANAWRSFRDTDQVNKCKSLIIGDSTVRSLNEKSINSTKVKSFPGGKIKDIQDEITVEDKYEKIIIVAGTNEVPDTTDVKDVIDKFNELITEAKNHANSIILSSVLPRTDTPDLLETISELNSELEKLCDDKVHFIDNDATFKLRDGSVNNGFLYDGLHLSKEGIRSLAKNLGVDTMENKDVYCRPYCGVSKPLTQGDMTDPQSTRNGPQQPRDSHNYPSRRTNDGPSCWNCGETNHLRNNCKHTNPLTCRRCGRAGHKEKLCWRYS